ncbi:hypothetical protein [Zestomonas thermotolerans]|uniref:hypothetical protein n=1 Tax=Zestomonas thermotolerans TaxID=157784 RepID=UPI0003668AFC|nr:hypothetical protein [Pseudomonas thermotolerans]
MEFTSFGKAIFWLALFFFASTALVYWPFNSWLEQQRVGELVLGAVGLAFLVGARQLHIGSVSKGLLLMAVLLGLISSLQAAYPLWALHEWSKTVGLIAVVLCCSMLFEKRGFVGALLVTIGVVTTVLAVQFLLFYLAALGKL